MKISRRGVIGVVVAALLVAWIVHQFHTNPTWRQLSWQAFWNATRQAQWRWLALATGLIYLSYLVRTWRWQVLMSPPGRFAPVLRGTLIGFTGLTLLGRPGELLVRPYYIARQHRTKLSPQLAVWVLERAFDVGGVVLVVGLALWFDPRMHNLAAGGAYQSAVHRAGVLLSAGVLVVIGGIYVFHRRSRRWLVRLAARRAERTAGGRPPRWEHFVEMLAHSTGGLTDARRLAVAVVSTLVLWVVISGSMWAGVRAYPAMLPTFAFSGAVVLMGLTAVGSVLQLPAVGGGFQVLVLFGLTRLFGAAPAAAASAALLIWLINFYAVAPLGVALAAHEGISWRGFEHDAERVEAREEAAAL